MSVVTSAIQLCDTPSLSGLWSWSANNACGTEILFFSFFRGHPFSFLPLILLTVSQSQLTDWHCILPFSEKNLMLTSSPFETLACLIKYILQCGNMNNFPQKEHKHSIHTFLNALLLLLLLGHHHHLMVLPKLHPSFPLSSHISVCGKWEAPSRSSNSITR